jgi:hypothetical protein
MLVEVGGILILLEQLTSYTLKTSSGTRPFLGLRPLDNKKGRSFERPSIIITIRITGTEYNLPHLYQQRHLNQSRRQRDSSLLHQRGDQQHHSVSTYQPSDRRSSDQ